MKNDLLAGQIDYQDNRPKGNDLFFWGVFLLLLTGVALAAWISSFYIFGQPERPYSYELLQKIKKIEPSKKFAVTAAPSGEFLTASRFYERYSKVPAYELDKQNTTFIRYFIHNFEQTKLKIPYLTGVYRVLKTQKLGETTLFPSGLGALAESVDEPKVLIEYLFTADEASTPKIEKLIRPGAEISLRKTEELCAVLRIQKLKDNRILATVVPLHYGTYTPADGTATFSLQPPGPLHMAAGWPVLRASIPAGLLQAPIETGIFAPPPPLAATPALVAAASTPPPPVAVATPIPVATPLPMSTPLVVAAATPLPTNGTAPRALPATPADPTTSLATATDTSPQRPAPVNPLPGNDVQVRPAIPVVSSSDTGGGSWPTYKPGSLPPGRPISVGDASNLADRGTGGERLYLDGSFVVTASNQNRAILRARTAFGGKGAARVIADFPAGMSAPGEGTVLSRTAERPFQVINVTRAANGDVNIYVREITSGEG